MRIMLFDASREWSGGANRVLLFSKELMRRGHHVTVCCLPGFEMACRLELAGIPFHTLNPGSDVNVMAVPELYRMIRENDIDLIDVHSPKFYWLALMAGRLSGRPVVITRNVPFRKSGVKKHINGFLYRDLVDQMIAISDKIKRELIEDFRIDSSSIEVIYDGIDISGFEPSELPASADNRGCPLRIGVMSRLVRGKGLECLIDAIPAIVRNVPDAHVVLAGSGEIGEQLRLQAQKLNIGDRITFAGFIEDVPGLLRGMAITVVPSPQEGMSMSALESMASGVPVVATTGGGLVDIIVDMENGLIVAPNDPEALADGVIRLLRSDYRAMGVKAKSVIEEKFALNRVVDQYEHLLTPLMHRKQAGAR